MPNRRTLTPARKIEIAELRHWRAPGGGVLSLENGKVCDLGTGEPTEVDHAWQIATGGPDTDDNLRHMSREDHKIKTRADAKARAKGRRLARRAIMLRQKHNNWPKGRKFGIPGLRKKLDGSVVEI